MVPRFILLLLVTLFTKSASVSGQLVRGDDRLRCYSCSTVNASHIVAGAGVDPGVFLTTIPLSSLPVTQRCADPFDPNDAIRAGAASTVCQHGLCVKMNYTDKMTGSSSTSGQQCYSCTTPDAEATLRGVEDKDWQRWLNSVKSVPRSPACADPFDGPSALSNRAVLEECEKGVCMKMWFKERAGAVQIWRTCIPNAQGVVRTDCTKLTSSEGDMEVCTCDQNACNSTAPTERIWAYYIWLVLFTAFFLFYANQAILCN